MVAIKLKLVDLILVPKEYKLFSFLIKSWFNVQNSLNNALNILKLINNVSICYFETFHNLNLMLDLIFLIDFLIDPIFVIYFLTIDGKFILYPRIKI